MGKPKIYFRADGNSEIGYGHVMRLLSIVQYSKSVFDCSFIIQSPSESILNIISRVCNKIIILPQFEYISEANVLVDIVKSKKGTLVLDGYNYNDEYKRTISEAGIKIISIVDTLFIDDNSDVLINHAGFENKNLFKVKRGAKIFLGPKYCMLRREFLLGANNTRKVKKNENVFICFGASDPLNYTISTLKKYKDLLRKKELKILIGSGYKFEKDLKHYLEKMNFNYSLFQNLLAKDIFDLMLKCWIGITSASTIAYEFLCSRGVLFLEKTAENQNNIFKYLISEKNAFPLSSFGNISNDHIELALQNQTKLFDGKSSERILNIFNEIVSWT